MSIDRSLDSERISDPWLCEHEDLLQSGLTALDFGCGNGDDSIELIERGLDVIAFDQSLKSLRHARHRAPEIRIVHGDMRKRLPFRDGMFDLVVSSLSMHYFTWEQSERIASEVRRVLKPTGWLICRVNRVGDLNFSYGEGDEIEPEYFEVGPGHFKRFFSEGSLSQLLETAFDVDSIVPRVSTRWKKEKQTLVARAKPRT